MIRVYIFVHPVFLIDTDKGNFTGLGRFDESGGISENDSKELQQKIKVWSATRGA